MRRLITKSARLAAQEAAFESLIRRGYVREDYKGLAIFRKEDQGKFYVDIFRDSSSKPITGNYYYRDSARVDQIISNAKSSYDSRLEYKAKQKAKGGFQTEAAMCAAQIREELKNVFPGIKFSVTSSTFSMGNSVDVRWVDGPTYDQVDEIISKYQYGSFNGMEDIYEYTNSREDIHQAKYVHSSRSMSSETKAVLEPIAAEKLEKDEYNRDTLYLIFKKTPLPAGAIVTGIENTDCKAGLTEEFYRISFENPNAPKQLESKSEPEFEKLEVKVGEVSIVEYSEKAIAVIGDTKSIKDKLMELGGKFNRNLSCGPGWIFSKKRLELVQNSLMTIANV